MLDEYARNWVGMHTDVCEASLRREQPADVHELRMQCLADRLETLRADVDLLVKPDQNVVERSLPAVESLPSIAGCGNVAALREPFPLPSDPGVRAKLSALNTQLANANAELAIGELPATPERAMEMAAQARALGYPRLEAQALLYLARVEGAMGDRTSIHPVTLRKAIQAADAGRDLELAAEAQARLAAALADRFGRLEEAVDLAEDAEARVRGLRWIDPGVHVEILGNCAGALLDAGRIDEARARLEQALVLSERSVHGTQSGLVLDRLSVLEIKQGHLRTALTSMRRAEAAYKAQLGDDHRRLRFLFTNVGEVQYLIDERSGALSALRRATDLFERNAPDHEINGFAHSYLGFTLARMGQAEAAAQSLKRGLVILQKSASPGGSMALLPLTGIARGLNDAGDPAKALALLGGAGVEDPQPRFEPWEIAWAKRELARALKALGREPSRVARLLSSVHETYVRFPEIVEPDGTLADERLAGRR
jgi:tetratricopeptide (TPR) repeat protein